MKRVCFGQPLAPQLASIDADDGMSCRIEARRHERGDLDAEWSRVELNQQTPIFRYDPNMIDHDHLHVDESGNRIEWRVGWLLRLRLGGCRLQRQPHYRSEEQAP